MGNRLSRAAAENDLTESLGYCEGTNRLETLDRSADTPEDQPAVREWVYNDAGRMSEYLEDGETVATYTVNALGQRVIKSVEGTSTVFHYDESGTLIGETHPDGAAKRDYLWLNGLPLAQIDVQGGAETIRYLHPDHLATARLATDEMGTVIWRWEGEAFGDAEPNEDPDLNGSTVTINLRFPGQYADGESEIYYNHLRDFVPNSGRYVQSDPIGIDGGTNSYLYANANPAGLIDIEGTQSNANNENTSLCAYYAAVGARFDCTYHKFAFGVCMGENIGVEIMNFLCNIDAGEKDCIRKCLIANDKKDRRNPQCRIPPNSGCGERECVRKSCIKNYHNDCFEKCDISPHCFGGNYRDFPNDDS